MELETLELRDRRYRAQQALKLLQDDEQAEERKALEEQIAHYQEICPHEHVDEVEGEWRCRDCDLQKTTAVPEPEPAPAPEPEPTPAAEAAPAAEPAPEAEPAPAAEAAQKAEPAPAAEAAQDVPATDAEEVRAGAEAPAGEETAGAEPEKPAGSDT